ncbi:hypothetical protein [Bradyrhizobium uaiense]|uniref:Uncharacterized protein n=1 Tax=Bradyrhizobium uaiense TaxID=2594946 RepID=A0A6P1BFZ4_9BRAD|nr:hypothetical protein [Bradyrhizobium uaiense]NEU97094.1 hypothetical protein [Bradyrhizobium uaiense]
MLLALACCGRDDFASSRALRRQVPSRVSAAADGTTAFPASSFKFPTTQIAKVTPPDDRDCRNILANMRRLAGLLASVMINASTIPAVAPECASSRDIDTSRARWAAVRTQPTKAADDQATCRSYAAPFHESVNLRQEAALCSGDTDHARNLTILDSEIDTFNNLLATRCGS